MARSAAPTSSATSALCRWARCRRSRRARDARRSPAGHPLDDADGSFAQAVAALRGELVRANVLARRTSVLLTAALPGEGTTTTALCVACAHARAGGRALLVDCDLRRPRLHALTGADNSHGLTSILLGERRLDEILHRDERSGALIVPAGPGTADPKAAACRRCDAPPAAAGGGGP